MIPEELKILKGQISNPFRYSNTELWRKAFWEYNEDHPQDRPLHTGCRSCYYKVLRYLDTKLYSDSTGVGLENPEAKTKQTK